jgi:hypothetical protein
MTIEIGIFLVLVLGAIALFTSEKCAVPSACSAAVC